MKGVALVTGAAVRIGRAIALALAEDGYAVALHYGTSRDAAEQLGAEIRAKGGAALTFAADLADPAQVERLVPTAAAALGPLTVLVNNASIFDFETADMTTLASWNRHLDINLRAPFFLAQAFAKQLPEDAEGNIVNLLDERVWRLTPFYTSYTISKVGLWGLTQTLAMAYAPRIRVNGIGPGPALANTRQTEAEFAEQCAAMPLGRGTDPGEICSALRFLLAAKSLTGQMVALDGGQHLEWRTIDKRRLQD